MAVLNAHKTHLTPADLYGLDTSFQDSFLCFQLVGSFHLPMMHTSVFKHLSVYGLFSLDLGISRSALMLDVCSTSR